jgi:hypothetical protein
MLYSDRRVFRLLFFCNLNVNFSLRIDYDKEMLYRSYFLTKNYEMPLLRDEELGRLVLNGINHFLFSLVIIIFCWKKTELYVV